MAPESHAIESFTGLNPAALSVDGVVWGAVAGRPIIGPLSFDIAAGQMLALVGPNGAGKSSLLRCLYRYHRPTSGQVRLDGADIWAMSSKAVARRVATVLQDPVSDFGLTVAEIVALGLTPHRQGWGSKNADFAAVRAALALMAVDHLAPRDMATLSGGERQRVMIARALVQRPDLLILDEPTNHLDIRHQLDVLDLLCRLPCTVVVSLHDLALAAAHADQVLLLDGGQTVGLGPPSAVLTPRAVRTSFAVETLLDAHPVTGRARMSFHLPNSAED